MSGDKVVAEVVVEVVATDETRARGFKYRDQVPEGTGMLFVFFEDKVQQFWMQDTRVPLDMIFIDRDLTVVGITHQAKPYDESIYSVDVPSRFVVEVPGGYCAKTGIHQGMKVELPL